MSEPNMVPFIDVMLVLLIIFMVTAPLITPSMIDLPSMGKAAKQPDVVVQIVVGKDEQLELRAQEKNTPVTLGALASAVRRAQTRPDGSEAERAAVVISADKSVRYESVVKVMDTLQRAGIERVGLSVQLAN
jgi:biopolymer transport protein TolR